MSSRQQLMLPDGYKAIPLSADAGGGSLRICVLLRSQPEAIGGNLVAVGTMIDGRILLGCLLDGDGSIHQWLEIAIQDVDRVASSLKSAREVLNNRLLDERFKRHCQAEDHPPHGPLLTCGWEKNHPRPSFIDPQTNLTINPVDKESGLDWTLCEDDGVLKQAGLAPFSSTLHRYLWLEAKGDESPFAAVTAGAPSNDRCKELSAIFEGFSGLVALNPSAGLMRVREFLPVRYETFNDLLGGSPYECNRLGREELDLGEKLELLHAVTSDPSEGDGWLFQGHHGRWGRLVETLHLKLKCLGDAVGSVKETVRQTKAPLLNLTAESFRIRMGAFGCGLPYLWSAQAQLSVPGEAVSLPIESSDFEYFLQGENEPSIYRSESTRASVRGRAMIRLREVVAETTEGIIYAGTLATQEKLEFARNDLIWLRMELKNGHFDLFARLDESEAMAAGEWRFRTIPLRLGAETKAILNEARGVPISDVQFEMLPLLSTPNDLYSLAVLAVRTLLVDKDNSLPVALDETLSLARQIALEYEESVPLRERIEAIFQRDGRWIESIGPHRLTHREITPQEALDLIPAELWYDTIGLVVQMLPGVGKDSLCRDFADAPIGGLHRVFEPVTEALGGLILRTRSLIVIDWRYNREITSVIRGFATGLGAQVQV